MPDIEDIPKIIPALQDIYQCNDDAFVNILTKLFVQDMYRNLEIKNSKIEYLENALKELKAERDRQLKLVEEFEVRFCYRDSDDPTLLSNQEKYKCQE